MSSASANENPVRVPRKRTVKKTSSAPRKRTVKKTAKKTTRTSTRPAQKLEAEFVREVDNTTAQSTESVRKAPTSFATERTGKRRKQHQIYVVAGVLVLGIATSAAIGFTDSGIIDVDSTIEARNERLRSNTANQNDTERSSQSVAVQNRGDDSKPDGGLIGLGIGAEPPPPPPPATTTASSTATTTDETASSTEESIAETATSTEAALDEGDEG